MNYEAYMGLALDQAALAAARGEFPVGCVIVQDGQVVAQGARTGTAHGCFMVSEVDHAEIRALKNMEICQQAVMPGKCTLFCTLEPCLMCYGAILLSGIGTIVYGFEDPMGGGICCDLTTLTPLYRDSRVRVVGGICRQKSLDLFYDFFNKKKNLYWKDSLLEAYTRKQKRLQDKKNK
ncbi:MAG: nucleoside deaminase [Desulfotignum sp.]|nr:nucleoside deaminase [Desulfobacteraceae bacterium]